MPDYDAAKYLIRNKAEIRNQLISLARKPDIITAYFNEGKRYMLTAVLGTIDDRGLVVLDFGPDDATTKQAIASGRLVCTAKHDGVPIRFSCENLKSARFQSLPAIAAPLPKSMHRLQRREFFRVTTPKLSGPRCEIPVPEGSLPHQLTILNISIGGAGMVDTSGRLHTQVLERFEGCRLFLPDHEVLEIDLIIRNNWTETTSNGELLSRYGISFEGLTVNDNAELQRYIFHLQILDPQ